MDPLQKLLFFFLSFLQISWIILAFLFVDASVQQNTVINYLNNQTNPNDVFFTDHYFICETNGTELVWLINGHLFPFVSDEVVGTALSSSPAPEFRYVSILLRNEAMLGSRIFASLLVLSVDNRLPNFTVVECFNNANDRVNKTTNDNVDALNAILNSTSGGDVLLQYLFNSTLTNNVTIYFYVCGVTTEDLTWDFNNTRIIFDGSDGVNTKLLQDNVQDYSVLIERGTLYSLAILMLQTRDLTVNCTDAILRTGSLTFAEILNALPISSGGGTTTTTREVPSLARKFFHEIAL